MDTDAVKITALELENVKRVKAVKLEPKESGLTVIGGRNGQGKTTILDSICWALGGKKYEPDKPQRDDSVSNPSLHVELSNGIVVDRSGKGSTLKVTDSTGAKAGQALLDTFIENPALDLPKFLNANDKDKAKTLLEIIGVENQLEALDKREASLTQSRLAAGQSARQSKAAAEAMAWFPDAPTEYVNITELADLQRLAIEHNADNKTTIMYFNREVGALENLEDRIAEARSRLQELERQHEEAKAKVERLSKEISALEDIDVTQYSAQIESAEEINEQIRSNEMRALAFKNAEELENKWKQLDSDVQAVRDERMALLKSVSMPLDGLTVEDGLLVYKGHTWGDMSGSEQLRVATAIVRKLKPACGFVLIDKLEQFDTQTLAEFGQWCESEDLQIIGTRVSTGDECSIIIEDGLVVQDNLKTEDAEPEQWPLEFAQPGIQPAGIVIPEQKPFKPLF